MKPLFYFLFLPIFCTIGDPFFCGEEKSTLVRASLSETCRKPYDIDHDLRSIPEIKEVKVLSQTQLLVEYELVYDPALISRSILYTINNKQVQSLILEENGKKIILELSTPLKPSTPALLSINWSLVVGLKSVEPLLFEVAFEDGIDQVFTLDENRISLIHNYELDPSSFSISDFTFVDSENEVTATEVDLNGLILILSQNLVEGKEYVLNVPARVTKSGNLLPATIRSIFFHASLNEIIHAEILGDNEVRLLFSQPLDEVNALIPDLYSLDGKHPRYVELGKDNMSVLLKGIETKSLSLKEDCIILVGGLYDFKGKIYALEQWLKLVRRTKNEMNFRSIVINEVMAAPRANNPLPNVEYIELYNTTDKPIDLSGFLLSNSRRSTTLPEFVLDAKAYVILTPRNQAGQFQPYGTTLGLTNWPTLLNAGDKLLLTDSEGIPMDSLAYTNATYGGSAIAQGGYSLELVNPYTFCQNSSNIKPSNSPFRGTPGTINSVYDPTPDRIAPKFVSSEVLHANQAVLYFSKLMQAPTNQLKIEVSPNLDIADVALNETNTGLVLRFNSEIQEGIKYEIRLTNLRDCSGNLFTDQEAYIVKPGQAVEGDVVLSEVLFNPRTGSPKFVEIYNTSSKYISLLDWKLANLNSDGEVANRRVLFTEEKLLEPHAFMVFTTNAEKLFQEYPKGKPERFVEYSSLPSYPISSGNVVFLNPDESLVEIFTYSDKMHHGLLRETKGVSLERLSYDQAVTNPSNWQSASASVGYATPGYRNSQSFDGNNDFGIEINPKVFVPDGPGEATITKIGYKMALPGQVGTINIYSVDGQLIRQLCQNAIWGEEGFYIWDGTFSNGTKVRPGYYLVWVEVLDLSGSVNHIKKTVVVGTKF